MLKTPQNPNKSETLCPKILKTQTSIPQTLETQNPQTPNTRGLKTWETLNLKDPNL